MGGGCFGGSCTSACGGGIFWFLLRGLGVVLIALLSLEDRFKALLNLFEGVRCFAIQLE